MLTESFKAFGFATSSLLSPTISRFNSAWEYATPVLAKFMPQKDVANEKAEEQPYQSKLRMSARLRQKECKYLLWRYAVQDFNRKFMGQMQECDYMISDYVIKLRDTIRVQMNDLRLFGKFLDSWV